MHTNHAVLLSPPAGRRLAALAVTALVLVLVATLSAVVGTSSAEAATRVSSFERAVVERVDAVRARKGLAPLPADAAMASCHDKYANRAARRMSRRGRFVPRTVAGAYTSCPSQALRHTAVRTRTARKAVRVMMRRPLVRRVLTAKRARTISLGTRRNSNGTWSVVAIIGGRRIVPTDGSEAGRMRTAIYADTNAARDDADLSPLSVDACLQVNAQRWADKLAAKGVLEHQDLSTVWDACGSSSWLGENVAYRWNADGSAMTVQWMESPGHRANILNSSPSLIGVGVASDDDGRWFGVQVFSAAFH